MLDTIQNVKAGLHIIDVSKIIYLPSLISTSKEPTAQLILRGIDLSLQSPSFVAITGPSGSGKSTLLRIISGIEVPTTGKVLFNGTSIHTLKKNKLLNFLRKNIYFIFQDSFKNFIPSLTVIENAKLIYSLGTSLKKDSNFITTFENYLQYIELPTSYGSRICSKLSGGEQQKIAILLALLSGARIILADEPTGNLNSEASRQIWTMFKQIKVEKNIWIITVSHNPEIQSYVEKSYSLRKGHFINE